MARPSHEIRDKLVARMAGLKDDRVKPTLVEEVIIEWLDERFGDEELPERASMRPGGDHG